MISTLLGQNSDGKTLLSKRRKHLRGWIDFMLGWKTCRFGPCFPRRALSWGYLHTEHRATPCCPAALPWHPGVPAEPPLASRPPSSTQGTGASRRNYFPPRCCLGIQRAKSQLPGMQLGYVVSYQFITRRHFGKTRKDIYFKMCAEKIYAGGRRDRVGRLEFCF